MGKASNCIKMLMILKASNIVSKDELASRLETNKRNIVEYRKELEEAGYVIEYFPGKDGGYKLDKRSIFVTPDLNLEEEKALINGITYIKTRNDFIDKENYILASEKILGDYNKDYNVGIKYLYSNDVIGNDIKNMIRDIDIAIKHRVRIKFNYLSLKKHVSELKTIDPYDLIEINNVYYVIGYCRDSYMYKVYKINNERMSNVEVSNVNYNIDNDYNLYDIIGKDSLFKDYCEVEFIVKGTQAKLMNEKDLGKYLNKTKLNDGNLLIKGKIHGAKYLLGYFLSFGSELEVIKPQEIVEQMKKEAKKVYQLYK